MALLFMDGFDAGDSLLKWTNTSSGNATTTSTRYGVGRALLITTNPVYKNLTAVSTLIVGVAMSSTASPSFYVSGDAGATLHITVQLTNTALLVTRGATQIASFNGSYVGGQYYYVEASISISDTVGAVVVRIDGTQVINFSGDTKNGGTANTIDRVTLNSSGAGGVFDDFYLCDTAGSAPYNTFLGDVRVATLVPNGAGSSTGFTPSTGANYTTVDELPYSATDYVSAVSSGTRDLYAMSDLSGTYNVLAVQNNVIAKKTDAGGTAIKPAIKSGATVYYGSNTTLSAADQVLTDLRTTDPATGAAWTQSGVNALESGVEIV